MVDFNDRTIFEYIKPFDNDNLSMYMDDGILDFIYFLNKYFLEYRDVLGFGSDICFGIEIEMDKFRGSVMEHWPFECGLRELLGNDRWIVKNDITLNWGREIESDILYNNIDCWKDIRMACDYASLYGEIDRTCAGHIHVGSQIFGNNILYWYRLFWLWKIYENVIYRFCYGEYLSYRDKILDYAKPCASFFEERLSVFKDRIGLCGMNEFLCGLIPEGMNIDFMKKYGISFWHMLGDSEYNLFEDFSKFNRGCTIELRVPNGTLNEIVWQNNINFFVHLMLYCKSDRFDEDILNRRMREVVGIFSKIDEYNKIYLEQAMELCDMIFDNNIDKIYFLRQYIKSFEVVDKPFVLAKRYTIKK